MPQETFLELAAWYHRLGRLAETEQVLEVAPPNAEVLYWLARVKDERGDPGASAVLQRAEAASPERVFPFRAESAEVMAWAASKSASWRPRYYQALVQWGAGNVDEARRLFEACGETPDYAPFYAARSLAFEGASRERSMADLERAARLDPAQWRYGRMLADRQLRQGQAAAGLETARRYAAQFPQNYILGMLDARALLANGRYQDGAAKLARLNVIPYEGSIEGRRLYREAHLMLAVEALKKGDTRGAQREVDAARLWPENLGAGKPYPADVDERLEDFLAAQGRAPQRRRPSCSRRSTAFEGRERGGSTLVRRAGPEADRPRGRGREAPRRLVGPPAREPARGLGHSAPTTARWVRCRRAPPRTRGCWRRGWPPRDPSGGGLMSPRRPFLLGLALGLVAAAAEARVVGITIERREPVLAGRPFGLAGPYETLVGTVAFALDPSLRQNRAVVDLDLAPRNERGEVVFTADVFILKPVDVRRGNGRVYYEVPNRGGKGILRRLQYAEPSLDPRGPADFGDAWLMEQGFSIAWMGWQWDVPERPGLLRLRAPIATSGGRPIEGLVRSVVIVGERKDEAPLGDSSHLAYPPVEPDGRDSRLYVRDHRLDPTRLLPRKIWRFVGTSRVASTAASSRDASTRSSTAAATRASPGAASPPPATWSASSRARPERRTRWRASRSPWATASRRAVASCATSSSRASTRTSGGGASSTASSSRWPGPGAARSTTASRRPRATATSTGTSATRRTSSPSPTGPRRTPRPARRPGFSTVRCASGHGPESLPRGDVLRVLEPAGLPDAHRPDRHPGRGTPRHEPRVPDRLGPARTRHPAPRRGRERRQRRALPHEPQRLPPRDPRAR